MNRKDCLVEKEYTHPASSDFIFDEKVLTEKQVLSSVISIAI
jgi:hypothetical protein